MSTSNKNKNKSSELVQIVLALDTALSELFRLGERIEKIELGTDADMEQAQHLMGYFAQRAQEVASGVTGLAGAINEARTLAEAAAHLVSSRADQLQAYKDEREKKMEVFRLLGEKVLALNASLDDLKIPAGEEVSDDDRAKISARFFELETQLQPLIEEAGQIKAEAKISKMTALEQNAHSLQQSLSALSKKVGQFQPVVH